MAHTHDPSEITRVYDPDGFRCSCGALLVDAEVIAEALGPGPWSYDTLRLVAHKVLMQDDARLEADADAFLGTAEWEEGIPDGWTAEEWQREIYDH
jgi:hypothetical protein